jgi:hypothetical protein
MWNAQLPRNARLPVLRYIQSTRPRDDAAADAVQFLASMAPAFLIRVSAGAAKLVQAS